MNFDRRQILSGILGLKIGILLLFLGSAMSTANASEKSCPIHPVTLNIIQNLYGKSELKKTDQITFNRENEFIAERLRDTRLAITFEPTVIHTPISIIIEKHNRYRGDFYGSELLGKYKTNGKVSSIGFSADIITFTDRPHGGEVNIFAVAKSDKSVVYTCLKIFYSFGEDGCC